LIGSEAVRETPGSLQPIALKSKRELARQMLHEYSTYLGAAQVHKLLVPALRVPWQDVLDEWFSSFEQINYDSILEVFLEHVADYRVQRRTRARLDQVRWFCLPVYPYMDDRLYRAYRRLPLSQVHGEQASIALLCSYKTGLRSCRPRPSGLVCRWIRPTATAISSMEAASCATVWRIRLTEMARDQGCLGVGPKRVESRKAGRAAQVGAMPLFHWPEVKNLIDKAARGTFVNVSALNVLINAGIVAEFLFGAGLSGPRALRFMKSTRDVRFLRPEAPAEIKI
jgi:hypothetical protein